MTQQDLSEFKCSDSEGDDADKSVKYVSFLFFLIRYSVAQLYSQSFNRASFDFFYLNYIELISNN